MSIGVCSMNSLVCFSLPSHTQHNKYSWCVHALWHVHMYVCTHVECMSHHLPHVYVRMCTLFVLGHECKYVCMYQCAFYLSPWSQWMWTTSWACMECMRSTWTTWSPDLMRNSLMTSSGDLQQCTKSLSNLPPCLGCSETLAQHATHIRTDTYIRITGTFPSVVTLRSHGQWLCSTIVLVPSGRRWRSCWRRSRWGSGGLAHCCLSTTASCVQFTVVPNTLSSLCRALMVGHSGMRLCNSSQRTYA